MQKKSSHLSHQTKKSQKLQTRKNRLKAEWEKQRAILLSFPHENSDWASHIDEARECFVEIIKAITQFEKVIICLDTQDLQGFVFLQNEFASDFAKSTTKNFHTLSFSTLKLSQSITIAFVPTNDTWARDFGVITLSSQSPKKPPKNVLLNFCFNGWGLKYSANFDNQINANLKKMKILKDTMRTIDFVLEGGSIDTDGAGTLLTTSACLLEPNRNPSLSKSQIQSKLKKTLGISRVLWVDFGYLRGDDTDSHIDMLARFVDRQTIAYVGCDDINDEHYEELAKMQAQLKSFRQKNGKPYKLIRLPFVSAIYEASDDSASGDKKERLPASYANFLFVNGGLLVPTYDDKNDKKAIEILSNALPHLRVVGVNARTLIKWHGSLHCITMQLY